MAVSHPSMYYFLSLHDALPIYHFAGVAQDEIVDSFVWCEILRQWSTFHPEFSYLPRKFKIAVNGAKADRAAVGVQDRKSTRLNASDGYISYAVVCLKKKNHDFA